MIDIGDVEPLSFNSSSPEITWQWGPDLKYESLQAIWICIERGHFVLLLDTSPNRVQSINTRGRKKTQITAGYSAASPGSAPSGQRCSGSPTPG